MHFERKIDFWDFDTNRNRDYRAKLRRGGGGGGGGGGSKGRKRARYYKCVLRGNYFIFGLQIRLHARYYRRFLREKLTFGGKVGVENVLGVISAF